MSDGKHRGSDKYLGRAGFRGQEEDEAGTVKHQCRRRQLIGRYVETNTNPYDKRRKEIENAEPYVLRLLSLVTLATFALDVTALQAESARPPDTL